MRIKRLTTFLSFVCLLAACGPSARAMRARAATGDDVDADDTPVAPGGSGGARVTGLGGSGGTMSPGGTGGGGEAGNGGAGRMEPPDAAVDAPMTVDSAVVDAARVSVQDARPDGMYWQVFCPTDAGESRTECCASYCSCMTNNCASELPADCMNTCVTVKNWDLPCRIHNCYLSISPNSPQDHDSHCLHADGKNGKCTNR